MEKLGNQILPLHAKVRRTTVLSEQIKFLKQKRKYSLLAIESKTKRINTLKTYVQQLQKSNFLRSAIHLTDFPSKLCRLQKMLKQYRDGQAKKQLLLQAQQQLLGKQRKKFVSNLMKHIFTIDEVSVNQSDEDEQHTHYRIVAPILPVDGDYQSLISQEDTNAGISNAHTVSAGLMLTAMMVQCLSNILNIQFPNWADHQQFASDIKDTCSFNSDLETLDHNISYMAVKQGLDPTKLLHKNPIHNLKLFFDLIKKSKFVIDGMSPISNFSLLELQRFKQEEAGLKHWDVNDNEWQFIGEDDELEEETNEQDVAFSSSLSLYSSATSFLLSYLPEFSL